MGIPLFSFGSEYLPKDLDPFIYDSRIDISKLHVRVNGYEAAFTDAQPYIDENNRTMLPLRAAVEALGAEVAWDQSTRTASITKNDVTVKVTIGIYQDVLTPEEIETLHQYELTYGQISSTYETWVKKYGLDFEGVHKSDITRGDALANRIDEMVRRGCKDLEDLKMEDRYIPLEYPKNGTLIVPVDVVIQLDRYAPSEYQVYALTMTLLDQPVVQDGDCGWVNYLPD